MLPFPHRQKAHAGRATGNRLRGSRPGACDRRQQAPDDNPDDGTRGDPFASALAFHEATMGIPHASGCEPLVRDAHDPAPFLQVHDTADPGGDGLHGGSQCDLLVFGRGLRGHGVFAA